MERHNTPEKEPTEKQPMEFTEFQNLITDMYGIRGWSSYPEGREYIIWELNVADEEKPDNSLPYYRLIWAPYDPSAPPTGPVQSEMVDDFESLPAAESAARQHAGVENPEKED